MELLIPKPFTFKYISEKARVLVLKYISKVLRFSSTFQVHLSTFDLYASATTLFFMIKRLVIWGHL